MAWVRNASRVAEIGSSGTAGCGASAERATLQLTMMLSDKSLRNIGILLLRGLKQSLLRPDGERFHIAFLPKHDAALPSAVLKFDFVKCRRRPDSLKRDRLDRTSLLKRRLQLEQLRSGCSGPGQHS